MVVGVSGARKLMVVSAVMRTLFKSVFTGVSVVYCLCASCVVMVVS